MDRMNSRAKRLARVAAVGIALGGLTGCASQIAALKPVGGDALAGVRTATIDLVLAEGFEFLEAPVCTQTSEEIRCVGSTTENFKVTAVSVLDGTAAVSVMLGAETIYQGPVADVLEQAASDTL